MGGKFKQGKDFTKKSGPTSRKDFRKQLRKEKKAKKNEYFKNKKKIALLNTSVEETVKGKATPNIVKSKKFIPSKVLLKNTKEPNNIKVSVQPKSDYLDEQNKQHKQDLRDKAKLERGMVKLRKKVLLQANQAEDKEIKKLEKYLKLNKRKTKSLPKSFADEGLDYLLEVCDPEKLKEAGNAEMNLQDSGSEFEDDFAIVTGKGKRKSEHKENPTQKRKGKLAPHSVTDVEDNYMDDEFENSFAHEEDEEIDLNSSEEEDLTGHEEDEDAKSNDSEEEIESLGSKEVEGSEVNDGSEEDRTSGDDEEGSEGEEINGGSVNEECDMKIDGKESSENKKQKDGMWEDIYGRVRDKKGNVIQFQEKGKYIPPHLRAQQLAQVAKNSEELTRLKKQLKGFINRLAESNILSIANQIDELYMRNSRNDMNDSLLSLITEALVGHVLTSERLVMEHALLIAVLHANVGMEVGAHFLQTFVQRFDTLCKEGQDVENKTMDNILLIISHLYNFKVFHTVLMYNILDQLTETFSEKEVDLILLVLRSVGFSLRKDDPLALKELVLRLQKKASEATHLRDNSRVRFMLDVLLAVKNNNMAKIPQYDPSHCEHLKKLLKTLIHKGKYVTELKVTLEDLLKAEERGRWWIVGSAWSGAPSSIATSHTAGTAVDSQFSQAVLDLARKQRMNTDTRRNIFCILVTAEVNKTASALQDYLDAFEKLLRMGLKGQQEQEVIHVMMHCLLREKRYNPYYAHLATHFCQVDRKHQMTIQYRLWDKLKELSNLSQSKITNLAKFLAHLFLEKALPISVLKVMQFSDLDRACVRLLRQVMLSVLMSDSEEALAAVFMRVSRPDKLHMFRESLRLFLYHFVLRNATDLPEEQMLRLKDRVKLAEAALTSVDTSKFM